MLPPPSLYTFTRILLSRRHKEITVLIQCVDSNANTVVLRLIVLGAQNRSQKLVQDHIHIQCHLDPFHCFNAACLEQSHLALMKSPKASLTTRKVPDLVDLHQIFSLPSRGSLTVLIPSVIVLFQRDGIKHSHRTCFSVMLLSQSTAGREKYLLFCPMSPVTRTTSRHAQQSCICKLDGSLPEGYIKVPCSEIRKTRLCHQTNGPCPVHRRLEAKAH